MDRSEDGGDYYLRQKLSRNPSFIDCLLDEEEQHGGYLVRFPQEEDEEEKDYCYNCLNDCEECSLK